MSSGLKPRNASLLFSVVLGSCALMCNSDCRRRPSRKAATRLEPQRETRRRHIIDKKNPLMELLASIPKNAAFGLALTRLDSMRTVADLMMAGSVPCPGICLPGANGERRTRQLLEWTKGAQSLFDKVSGNRDKGLVFYLVPGPDGSRFSFGLKIRSSSSERIEKTLRSLSRQPYHALVIRRLLESLLGSNQKVQKALSNAALHCGKNEADLVTCTTEIDPSGVSKVIGRQKPGSRQALPPREIEGPFLANPLAGAYINLEAALSRSSSKAVARTWPGRPPRSLWLLAGGGEGPRPSLKVSLFAEKAQLDIIHDSPASMRKESRDLPTMKSYLVAHLDLPRLVSFLDHLEIVHKAINWVRTETVALPSLLLRNLSGTLMVGDSQAAPVAVVELNEDDPQDKLKGRLDLVAASAIGAYRKKSVSEEPRGKDRVTDSQPSLSFGKVVLTSGPASRILLRTVKSNEKLGLTPVAGETAVIWKRRGRYILATTKSAAFKQLTEAVLGKGLDSIRSRWPVHGRLVLDDPLASVDKEVAGRINAFLTHYLPYIKNWFPLLDCLADRADVLTFKIGPVGSGMMAVLSLGVVADPSSSEKERESYLSALRHKYSGHGDQYISSLRKLASALPDSVAGAKAARMLAARLAPHNTSSLGILGGLLFPFLLKERFVDWSREAEKETSKIASKIASYFQALSKKGGIPRGKPGWGLSDTPSRSHKKCCAYPYRLCPTDKKAFDHPTWRKLDFNIDQPHRYKYTVTCNTNRFEAVFTVTAKGDLDCNGVPGTLTIRVRVQRNGLSILSKPTWKNRLE